MGGPTPPVLDPTEVQIGNANGPGVYVAPAGTAGPADVAAAWPSAWTSLGYLSDDGPTISTNTDSQDFTPWQSTSPIRSVITGKQLTVEMIFWQLNARTLSMYFDTDVPTAATSGLISMQIRTDAPQHLYAIGIDSADVGRALRIIFPRASLSDAGDMQIQRGAAVPLDCTLSALDYGGVLAEVLLGTGAPQPVAMPLDLPGYQGVQTVGDAEARGGRRNGS